MATTIIRCECGKRLKVDSTLVGRRAKCPFCTKIFFVPKPAADPFTDLKPDSSILMFWPTKPSAEDDKNSGL